MKALYSLGVYLKDSHSIPVDLRIVPAVSGCKGSKKVVDCGSHG
jgi:hypothetical protein